MASQDSESIPKSGDYVRNRFAAERTLLAWIRTGLAFMGFGFVVARFGLFLHLIVETRQSAVPSPPVSLWIGTALVILGIVVNFLAAIEHRRILHRLDRGEAYQPPRWSLGLFVAAGLVILGIGIVAYLLHVGG